MKTFDTQINGIPCQCEVTHYSPYVPAKISYPPEDSHPAEASEFEFNILDESGNWLSKLEACLTSEDEQRLQDEYEAFIMAEKHGKDF